VKFGVSYGSNTALGAPGSPPDPVDCQQSPGDLGGDLLLFSQGTGSPPIPSALPHNRVNAAAANFTHSVKRTFDHKQFTDPQPVANPR
jgi:hypothetical protein